MRITLVALQPAQLILGLRLHLPYFVLERGLFFFKIGLHPLAQIAFFGDPRLAQFFLELRGAFFQFLLALTDRFFQRRATFIEVIFSLVDILFKRVAFTFQGFDPVSQRLECRLRFMLGAL